MKISYKDEGIVCERTGCERVTAPPRRFCSRVCYNDTRKKGLRACEFPGCGRPYEAGGLCKPHSKQQRLGKELIPIGDKEHLSELKRRQWASLTEEERRRRTEPMRSKIAPWTDERRAIWRASIQAKWASGGIEIEDRECPGCKSLFAPNSGSHVWCSEECFSLHRRALHYGVTDESMRQIWDQQKGRCAICGQSGRLHVDHDHESGLIRGFLCVTCNTALGKFGDNTKLLRTAIKYLEKESNANQL